MLENVDTAKALPITYNTWTLDVSLLAYAKRSKEQGTWSAKAALEILDGKAPADIPISKNVEGDLLLNTTFAEKFGVTFSAADLAAGQAKPTPTQMITPWKVAFVNSYTFEADDGAMGWAKGIYAGVEEVLGSRIASGAVVVQPFHMDTKRNLGEPFAIMSAGMVKTEIDAFKPDVILACDDAAVKYLIVPNYIGADKPPVVVCGVNFDATKYGLPVPNVTGMLEVPPVDLLVEALKKYDPAGMTLGYITFDDMSEKANTAGITSVFGLPLTEANTRYVLDMVAWKAAYIELKTQVDFLIMGSANFMMGWKWSEAHQFILDNTVAGEALPGTYNPWTLDISLLAFSKRSSEQGSKSALMALDVLQGVSPMDIPMEKNVSADLTLNQELATKLGVTFTAEHLATGMVKPTPINMDAPPPAAGGAAAGGAGGAQ
jgi:hypothetical protein